MGLEVSSSINTVQQKAWGLNLIGAHSMKEWPVTLITEVLNQNSFNVIYYSARINLRKNFSPMLAWINIIFVYLYDCGKISLIGFRVMQ